MTTGISLCMIVKNETDTLAACLDSVKGLVNEIILVDTGSTDQTVELARSFGATVFSCPWQGDFAAARNFSLAQASGNWLLVLDADETLAPGSPAILLQEIRQPGVEGFYIPIRNFIADGHTYVADQAVRLFRNKPAYRFTGAIHEQVAGSIQDTNHGQGLAVSQATILHRGYLAAVIQRKEKQARNITLLKSALASAPSDPFLLYSLAAEYMQAEDFNQAENLLHQSLSHMHGTEGFGAPALYALLFCLYQNKKWEELSRLLADALRSNPENANLFFFRGLLAAASNDAPAALADFATAARQGADTVPRHYIATLCGNLCLALEDWPQAANWFLLAWQEQPRSPYVLEQFLFLNRQESVQINWEELASSYPGEPEEPLANPRLVWANWLLSILRFSAGATSAAACLDRKSGLPVPGGASLPPEWRYLTLVAAEIHGILLLCNNHPAYKPVCLTAKIRHTAIAGLEILSRLDSSDPKTLSELPPKERSSL
ncbi:nucleotide-diphospho-sugar transferases [Lucifera butyrica]|uniref:Nucleotide-diphospho-sugar transferases n=1 Tax=Lucifera butyrica TaxID=1351585 RepID=A0A498R3P6_9FIRM|nr:glycosyltransferase family 2 protein [Lucifera butyrica]VBB05477.1 nucleotide-diphospho-sugar transferases [Lucifera butyrica]